MADARTQADSPQSTPNARHRRGWAFARIGLLATFLTALTVIVWYGFFRDSNQPTKPPLPDLASLNDDLEEPIAVRNPGYLGPQACAPCHAARYAEFMKTPHARACRRPQDGPMPDGFNGSRGNYITCDPGLRFHMTRENGEYFQTAIQTTLDGEKRSKSRIDLVYGANKADEVFFTWRGDRLYESMCVWIHPTQEWGNTSYNRYGDGAFTREATTRCLECHTTWFEHVPGTPNQYKPDSFILGVTCEKCHGPGQEHVRFHQANPTVRDAHAVFHPGNTSRQRLIEVCTQCHGNSTKTRGPAHSYRPGESLEDYYRTAVTRHPEQDHVANQIRYLRQSKCFQKSETMTCVTCHDPHKPHDRADIATATKSCFQCHKPEACSDRPNLPVAVRDDCIACHMRQQVWMNVEFNTKNERYEPPVRRYQHRIGKDPVARSEVLLAWHRKNNDEISRRETERLTNELVDYWLNEATARQRDYRFTAAIGALREAVRLDPPPLLRKTVDARLADAIATRKQLDDDWIEALHAINQQRSADAFARLKGIIAIKPDFAAVHSKLGTLYASAGQFDLAGSHLQSVAQHDPDNASGLMMLGWLAYLSNRASDAIEFYRKAEQIEPYQAKLNYHWGLALIKLERWDEAENRFRKTVEVDPNHTGGYQGLAHALLKQGRAKEAIRFAWRAAKLTDFAATDVLITLAEVYAEAGKISEAAAAATKAIEIEHNGGPQMGFYVRSRLDEIVSRAGH